MGVGFRTGRVAKLNGSVLHVGKPSSVMLVTFLVVAYSLCSSMLLILNKVRITAMLTGIEVFP